MSLLLPLIAAIGTAATAIGQHQANQRAKGEANKNRLWQEQQTNTAHQRQVNDLRAAGLNPILSANSGASAGAGAQAQQENTMSSMANSANDVARIQFEKRKQEADISLQEAQKKGIEASARQSDSASIANKAQASKTAMETYLLKKDIPKTDVISGAYEWARKKAREAAESHATRQNSDKKWVRDYMDDFDNRMRKRDRKSPSYNNSRDYFGPN